MKKIVTLAVVVFALIACKNTTQQPDATNPSDSLNVDETFILDTLGKKIEVFTLINEGGLEVKMSNFGARVLSLKMPDKNGDFDDVALGFSSIEPYFGESMYLGCIVGRFANRLKDGKFTIDGETYQVIQKEGANGLHGGIKGYDKMIWNGKQDGNKIVFTHTSPDGEQGFPGKVEITHTVTLTPQNEIVFEFEATTDKKTIINLTNHTYLNFKGDGNGDILDHYITINADKYTSIDSNSIPTGELTSVEGTPFDFRTATKVGEKVNDDNIDLKHGKGYDHNWVLNLSDTTDLNFACSLYEETSGRMLDIYTTEPGVQFYCGNFMDGGTVGKSGKKYNFRNGLLFEPQHFPDSPNQDSFPSTLLNPGEKYYHKSVYKFSVKK